MPLTRAGCSPRPRRGVPGSISCMRHRFSKTSPATASDARSKSRSSPPGGCVPKRVQRRCRSECGFRATAISSVRSTDQGRRRKQRGSDMRHSGLAGTVLLAGIVAFQPSQTSSATTTLRQTPGPTSWKPPRTQDGQPDLQGVWLNSSATPLERPKALEGRSSLTDAEVENLKRNADRLFKDGNADLPVGDGLFLAALANPEQYRSANGSNRSAAYMVQREFEHRTSLITNPADGRIPALTPEAPQGPAALPGNGA